MKEEGDSREIGRFCQGECSGPDKISGCGMKTLDICSPNKSALSLSETAKEPLGLASDGI